MSAERKPAGQSWESFTERRIREALEAGAFANLPGLGRPIPSLDEPLDENWWLRRKLRDEGLSVVPPVLAARRERERLLAAILDMDIEAEVRRRLAALNEQIRQAHFSVVAGPADGVEPVDIEAEIRRWRQHHETRTRPTT